MRRWRIKAGGAAPLGDLGIAEAEAAMGVLVAQEFEVVRRKIDQHQDPARPQHPGSFGNRRRRPVGIMEDLMDYDRIKGRVGQAPADTCRRGGPVRLPTRHVRD